MSKDQKRPMTIISLTTIPSRIAHIQPCIESLIAQGLPVYVWIPQYVKRTGDTIGAVPDFLFADGIHVELVGDCGPITKLLPALACGLDVILTADDDHIYGDGWADTLLRYAEQYPNAAICYRGRVFESRKYNESRVISNPDELAAVDFITGVKGALYKREFFEEEIFEEWKKWPTNDDIVISGHLRRGGISMLVVKRPCKIEPYDVQYIDNLWDDVNARSNDEGLERAYW